MPKYYLLTLGCQMNKNDSERIVGLLNSIGFEESLSEEADLLIVNTCSVRQSAENKAFGFINKWQKYREKNPNLIVAVTGCMPGRDKDNKIQKKIKGVDLFFGIDELPMLPKWLEGLNLELFNNSKEGLGVKKEKDYDYLDIKPLRNTSYQSFITIQTGCNNFCTYCVVPKARGRERNRASKEIIKEVRDAIENGAKEIVLLGQVVNNYKCSDPENFSKNNPYLKKDDFASLLWEINRLDGNFRLTWTAADPQYFNDYQVDALKLEKQLNYLHLPVQSGDNEMLRRMNRKYTREYYIDLIKKIHSVCPDMALGTDIIVGFCGETDEQFQNTVDLFKKCNFDISYHAKYSERSGTTAEKAFDDSISLDVKKERWEVLQNLTEKNALLKNQKYLDKIVDVLVFAYDNGICSGNSGEMKLVKFLDGEDLVGKMVKVKISFADTWLLKGEII